MCLTLAMNQGSVLHPQLPMQDYSLSSDHDYTEQFTAQTHHHPSFANSGTINPLRRDGANVHGPTPFAFTVANGANGGRYIPSRGSETSSYQTPNGFTNSNGGSISTSPSPATSSLAYTGYQQNQCTAVPASFSASTQLPQSFVSGLPIPFPARVPTLDGASSGMLPPPNPIRSPISGSGSAIERGAYANSTPFLARTQLSPSSQAGYASYPETPRSSLGITGLSLSNSSGHYASGQSHMASPAYNTQSDCGNFPWPTLEIHAEMTCGDQAVTPEVHAKVEKGFFRSTSDSKWTCYRRNYFSVQCNFELHPNVNGGRLSLKRSSSTTSEMIQAMGMRLTAAVDGSAGKTIELVQHTPKRDNGPKNKIEVQKVSPTLLNGRNEHNVSPHGMYQVPFSPFSTTGQVTGPYLPLQNSADTSGSPAGVQSSQMTSGYPPYTAAASHLPVAGQNTTHTFERVQFKQATANNGKRRASQQYFHLIVELFADVRKEATDDPQWVKVAHRVSEKIVVRGRSPSHYQNEGQHPNGRTGSSGGGSGYGCTVGPTYGSLGSGSFRTNPSGSSSGYTGGMYRTNNALSGFHPSPEHSGSSSSSIDGGANDSEYAGDQVMSNAESDLSGQEGYRGYSLHEDLSHASVPPGKLENTTRFSADVSPWTIKSENSDAVPAAHWPVHTLSRYQSVESGRGYFAGDLTTNFS